MADYMDSFKSTLRIYNTHHRRKGKERNKLDYTRIMKAVRPKGSGRTRWSLTASKNPAL
jgi:hypothetical protein